DASPDRFGEDTRHHVQRDLSHWQCRRRPQMVCNAAYGRARGSAVLHGGEQRQAHVPQPGREPLRRAAVWWLPVHVLAGRLAELSDSAPGDFEERAVTRQPFLILTDLGAPTRRTEVTEEHSNSVPAA